MAKARFVTPSLTQAVVSSISVASPLGKIEMDGSTTPITGRGKEDCTQNHPGATTPVV